MYFFQFKTKQHAMATCKWLLVDWPTACKQLKPTSPSNRQYLSIPQILRKLNQPDASCEPTNFDELCLLIHLTYKFLIALRIPKFKILCANNC